MPVIRNNPQQALIELLYGFGSHEFESCALEMRAKRNIISAKEKSKTSHSNQAYDQLISKNDNKKATDTLACQRKMKHEKKGVVDHYQLVFTVISLAKETTQQIWVNSFRCVGLDPLNWSTWDEWGR